MSFTIREGKKEDIPQLLALIKELAEYERALDQVDNTEERMLKDGFGQQPVFGFYVVESEDRSIIGTAIYYYRYSTWKGKCLYLEDFVVQESLRGQGLGKLLFDKIVEKAIAEDCRLITWQVLDWNEPAINFYKKINSEFEGGWVNCRLSKEEMGKYRFGILD